MKKFLCFCMALVLSFGILGCGKTTEKSESIDVTKKTKNVAAVKVDELILAIGEVSIDSEDAICTAQTEYDALTDEQKAEIENYDVLCAAQDTYNNLVSQERILDCENAINIIGNVTIFSGEAIKDALEKYAELSADEKANITNYAVLTSADAQYTEIIDSETIRLLDNASSVFSVQYDKVENTTLYMPRNKETLLTSGSAVIAYIGCEDSRPGIRYMCSYLGNRWLFWDTLKIYIDGNTIEKTFEKDPMRQSAGFKVVEYMDFGGVKCLPIDDENFQLFKRIAESQETIIRFAGNNGFEDHTVTQEEKNTILDVLKLYIVLLEKSSET